MAIEICDAKPLKRMAAAFLVLGVLQFLNTLYDGEYWLNLTDSEPRGLYRVYPAEREIRRGDLVVMTVPEPFRQYVYGRGWIPEGWALFKHVGAVAGDTFCVGTFLTINGKTVGPVYPADEEGHPLPQLKGCGLVPAGHFLPVATRIKRSFDGRYMGPVRLDLIQGVARPVLTVE